VLNSYYITTLEWIRNQNEAGIAVFVGVYVLGCIFFLPGSVLTLGAGAIYGVVKGSVIVSISATLGAAAAFWVGRTLARKIIEKKIEANPKFKSLDEAVAKEGWKIVGLTRLSPIFPFNFLNYAYGLTRVSFRDYFFASWIGMLPGTILYVYIGSLAGNLAESAHKPPAAAQWTFRIIGFLATLAVTVLITKIARKALNQKLQP